jgi:DNA-binding MarR family transcriptional regulator
MDDVAAPLDLETQVADRPLDHKTELRLWLRMLTCTNLIESNVRRRLREEFDVTLPRFDLMAQLDKVPDGMTLGELSRRMMVSNGNVTAIVEALLAAGLVDRRAAHQDRRAQVVRLTADGGALFRRMARAHEAWIAETFDGLSAAEIDRLMALLGRAKASARQAAGRTQA